MATWACLAWACTVALTAHAAPPAAIPEPTGLDKVPKSKRFDWLLDGMERDHACFEYVKLKYFTLPTVRPGMFPDPSPTAGEALKIVARRLREHERADFADIDAEERRRIVAAYLTVLGALGRHDEMLAAHKGLHQKGLSGRSEGLAACQAAIDAADDTVADERAALVQARDELLQAALDEPGPPADVLVVARMLVKQQRDTEAAGYLARFLGTSDAALERVNAGIALAELYGKWGRRTTRSGRAELAMAGADRRVKGTLPASIAPPPGPAAAAEYYTRALAACDLATAVQLADSMPEKAAKIQLAGTRKRIEKLLSAAKEPAGRPAPETGAP